MNETQAIGVPTGEELELINKLSRRELRADEVYTFNVTLCDNEVDRDCERFSVQAIEKLCGLFLGKTGILDHSMKSSDQTARIFSTEVCTEDSRKTTAGEVYTYLKAKAYMLRTESNADLIAQIDGGIKKEVSVSCSVAASVCSICGENLKTGHCEHRLGKTYANRLCCAVLSEPTDAYEWSFVAVPAQREAGVTKSFGASYTDKRGLDILKSCNGDVLLTGEQAKELRKAVESLTQFAEDGKSYRMELCAQIEKYAHLALPRLKGVSCEAVCKAMSIAELCSLRDGLLSHANDSMPLSLQLKPQSKQENTSNQSYKI